MALVMEIIWIMAAEPTLRVCIPSENFEYGYPYQIILGLCFFGVFYYIRGDHILDKIQHIVSEIARLTEGIFCIHLPVRFILQEMLDNFGLSGRRSMFFCVCVFWVCLLMSYAVSKLPWKWCADIIR